MFGIGWTELLLILGIILLLFGGSRLPAAMAGLGKGIKEFKKAIKSEDEQIGTAPEAPAMAAQLRPGLGKHVRLLPDGTLEVGVQEGATLVQVDQAWAVIQESDSSTGKIPLVSVKRIVFRA